jgi:putative acetyltransferase
LKCLPGERNFTHKNHSDLAFKSIYLENPLISENISPMMSYIRTNSKDQYFQTLVKALDIELGIRDGEEHSFYDQFNKLDNIKHVIVAFEGEEAIGCGAIKEYSEESMEVKRMFVPAQRRGQGIASGILKELENWCRELQYKKCILETGKKQPEAIGLYQKNHYKLIPNYGQYKNIENSVCFEKDL